MLTARLLLLAGRLLGDAEHPWRALLITFGLVAGVMTLLLPFVGSKFNGPESWASAVATASVMGVIAGPIVTLVTSRQVSR